MAGMLLNEVSFLSKNNKGSIQSFKLQILPFHQCCQLPLPNVNGHRCSLPIQENHQEKQRRFCLAC